MLAVDAQPAKRVAARLQIVIAVGALALLGATWRLWTPQTVFPRIPFLRAAAAIPELFEWIGAGLLVSSMVASLLFRPESRLKRGALLTFSAAMVFMVLCDQERLQTWAYQFMILACVLAFVPSQRSVPLIRLFVISIYFHSALSKMSMGFLEPAGPGQMLVFGLRTALPFEGLRDLSMLEKGLEVLLPLTELIVALLLLFPRSRRAGLWGSLGMHLLLLLTLGPFGLNHKPGVLLWNVYFLAQNVVLFGPLSARHSVAEAACQTDPAHSDALDTQTTAAQIAPGRTFSPAGWFAQCLIVAAMLLPFLEPFGLYDVWPSWAVYAGGPEKMVVLLNAETRDKLPEWLLRHTSTQRIDGWNRLMIDRWALETLDAPIYPQVRSQLGIALWIACLANSDEGVRVSIYGRAHRLTGERSFRMLQSTEEIERELNTYWLNGYPRDLPSSKK